MVTITTKFLFKNEDKILIIKESIEVSHLFLLIIVNLESILSPYLLYRISS
jgi:hypothetical protein